MRRTDRSVRHPFSSSPRRTWKTPGARPTWMSLAYIDEQLDYKNNSFTLDNPLITQNRLRRRASRSIASKPSSTSCINRATTGNCVSAEPPTFREACHTGSGSDEGQRFPFLYQMLPAGIAASRATNSRLFNSPTRHTAVSATTRMIWCWPRWTRC